MHARRTGSHGDAAFRHGRRRVGPGRVAVDGVTAPAGMALGLRVEFGVGPDGSDPARDAAWRWTEATFSGDVDGADRYAAHLRPDTAGASAVAMRVSTTGGATWTTAISTAAPTGSRPSRPCGSPRCRQRRRSAARARRADGPGRRGGSRHAPLGGGGGGRPVPLPGPACEARADRTQRSSRRRRPPHRHHGGGRRPMLRRRGGGHGSTAPLPRRNSSWRPQARGAGDLHRHPPRLHPPGDTIFIAGDFQGWNPGDTPMTRATDGPGPSP